MATLRRVTEEIISNWDLDKNDLELTTAIRHLQSSGYATLKEDVEKVIDEFLSAKGENASYAQMEIAEELRDLCL